MWTRVALCWLVITSLFAAAAQQQLVVNGRVVEGYDPGLIPGAGYVEADRFAAALGASYLYSEGKAVFELGGRYATLDVFGDPESAAAAKQSLTLDGQPLASMGGVLVDGTVFVLARTVAMAFGGSVAYLADRNVVVVVMPRASLAPVVGPIGVTGVYERFIFRLSEPTGYSLTRGSAPGEYILSLARTDAVQSERFTGEGIRTASLVSDPSQTRFVVELEPGYSLDSYAYPQGRGFDLVLDIYPVLESATTNGTGSKLIVIDPGHGGGDTGFMFPVGSEAALTLAFAQRLRGALEDRGYPVRLSRTSDIALSSQRRSDAGVSASLFISVHTAPLPAGAYNLYYLGDAPDLDSLNAAIRENAETTLATLRTDSLRRDILLGLLPDLPAGERFARSLSSQLNMTGRYRDEALEPAPLHVLGGAAGRGLLLEFNPDDLRSSDLLELIAEAVTVLIPPPESP